MPAAKTRYKMQHLEQRTGVNRETIRFYIHEGLLPEPERTSRNMAWYSERHVELVKLIRQLQEREFLPLRAIKALIHDTDDYEFTPRQKEVFALISERLGTGLASPETSAPLKKTRDRLGYSQAEMDELCRLGVIQAEGGALSALDVEILTQWAKLRRSVLSAERGVTSEDLGIVMSAVDYLFSREVRFFVQKLSDLADKEAELILTEVIPGVNRLFALMHERKVRSFASQFGRSEKASAE